MQVLIISGAVLFGWAVRKKSAEVLKIRKANQARRNRLRQAAMREKSWRQVMEVGGTLK